MSDEGRLNRELADPTQPGASFWPATVEEHRVLLAGLEAELKSALATIRALHRCPHCHRALTASDGFSGPEGPIRGDRAG